MKIPNTYDRSGYTMRKWWIFVQHQKQNYSACRQSLKIQFSCHILKQDNYLETFIEWQSTFLEACLIQRNTSCELFKLIIMRTLNLNYTHKSLKLVLFDSLYTIIWLKSVLFFVIIYVKIIILKIFIKISQSIYATIHSLLFFFCYFICSSFFFLSWFCYFFFYLFLSLSISLSKMRW